MKFKIVEDPIDLTKYVINIGLIKYVKKIDVQRSSIEYGDDPGHYSITLHIPFEELIKKLELI